MGTVFLPTQGSFEFQGEAGTEKLLVLMSGFGEQWNGEPT
jgi:hypothetical protein